MRQYSIRILIGLYCLAVTLLLFLVSQAVIFSSQRAKVRVIADGSFRHAALDWHGRQNNRRLCAQALRKSPQEAQIKTVIYMYRECIIMLVFHRFSEILVMSLTNCNLLAHE